MLYECKGKLYAQTASGYAEVTFSVSDGGVTITPIGVAVHSRPAGATAITVNELIAQYGLAEGDVYPKRAVQSPQGATPRGSGGTDAKK